MDWIYPIFGFAGKVPNKRASGAAKANFLAAAAVLEEVLASRTYLTGHAISLADVVVAAQLVLPYLVVRPCVSNGPVLLHFALCTPSQRPAHVVCVGGSRQFSVASYVFCDVVCGTLLW